jgi:hypothetical protein
VAAVVLTLLLAACGKPKQQVSTEEDPLGVVIASAEDTLHEGTFRFESRTEVEAGTEGSMFDDECFGDLTWDEEPLTGVVDRNIDAIDVNGYPFGSGRAGETIATPREIFIASDELPDTIEVPTPWLAFSAVEAPVYAGPQPFLGLTGLGDAGTTLDPSQLLDALTEAAATVEEVGHEEVRGEATTRYAVTYDRDRYTAQAQAELDAMQETIETVPQEELFVDPLAALAEIPVPVPSAEVWIGDDGRVRRVDEWVPQSEMQRMFDAMQTMVEEQLASLDPEASAGMPVDPSAVFGDFPMPEFHVVTELHDFGGPDPIRLPEGDEVTRASEAGIEFWEVEEAVWAEEDETFLAEESLAEALPEGCEDELLLEGEAFEEGEAFDESPFPDEGLLGVMMNVPLSQELFDCEATVGFGDLESEIEVEVEVTDDTMVSNYPLDDTEIMGCLSEGARAAYTCMGNFADMTYQLAAPDPASVEEAVACSPPEYEDDIRCLAAVVRDLAALPMEDIDAPFEAPIPPECAGF